MTFGSQALDNFLLVAAHGSFSRAATIAGVSQSSLSRQIRKLENDCGCALFYRHGRGVLLTAEGELYLERLRPLIKQFTAARLDLRSTAQDVSGNVVLGMTPTIVELLGVRLLSTLRRLHPKTRLNVVSAYPGYVNEWLSADRLDIAILHDANRSSHISFEPLAEADLYLVSSPNALSRTERNAKSIEFRRLVELHLAMPSRHHGLRRTVDLAARNASLELRIEYEIDTLQLTKLLVVNDLAHTVLTLPDVAAELHEKRLIARRIVAPTLTSVLGSATATNRPITRATRSVLALIRTELEAAVSASPMKLGLAVNEYKLIRNL